MPITTLATRVPIVETAVPLPQVQPTAPVVQPSVIVITREPVVVTSAPIVVTSAPIGLTSVPTVVTPLPAQPTPVTETPGDGTFAVTSAVLTVEPETGQECPTTFLFTAQVTASGPGRVEYRWEFSNGQNPPPAVMEFRSAGTTVAQTSLLSTESQEGWGRVQFLDPVFPPSNQAAFVVNCQPAPSNALPATSTP